MLPLRLLPGHAEEAHRPVVKPSSIKANESPAKANERKRKRMTRRGNGFLDEATEKLKEEQEKGKDAKTAYEEKMLESQDEDEG